MLRKSFLFALLLTLLALPLAAGAQDAGGLVGGLNNPRALFYDADGNLWIGEAGTAGALMGESEMGPIAYGNSSRLLRLEAGDDSPEVVIANLPSAAGFDDMLGVNSVYRDEQGLWLVIGMGSLADPFNMSVINLDPETLRVKHFIDLFTFEAANNPDNDFIASNPGDIDSDGSGTYYILDFSGNTLLTWTADAGLQLFHAWDDLPVPTAVDVAPDGTIYVGFLSAFPFTTGSARVEQWSPDGTLLNTFSGLTGVTDVLVANDGTVYAVQLADAFGDLGWNANTGSVVMLGADGAITPVTTGLNFPYRLAISPSGALAVTVNSAFSGEASGQVLALSGSAASQAASGDDSGTETETEVEAPAETPEASG